MVAANPSGVPGASQPRPTPDGEVAGIKKGSHPDATRLEEPQDVGLDPAELVIVDLDAVDATLGGEHLRLRAEILRRQDPPNFAELPAQPREVPRELLDAVDLPASLDLDRDVGAGVIAAEQVDRPDVSRVLPPDQSEPRLDDVA